MKIILCTLAAALSISCIAPQPAPIQFMPYQADDPGVRAGCVRALSRVVVDYGLYLIVPMDEIYRRCDEVERSFQDEIRRGKPIV